MTVTVDDTTRPRDKLGQIIQVGDLVAFPRSTSGSSTLRIGQVTATRTNSHGWGVTVHPLNFSEEARTPRRIAMGSRAVVLQNAARSVLISKTPSAAIRAMFQRPVPGQTRDPAPPPEVQVYNPFQR